GKAPEPLQLKAAKFEAAALQCRIETQGMHVALEQHQCIDIAIATRLRQRDCIAMHDALTSVRIKTRRDETSVSRLDLKPQSIPSCRQPGGSAVTGLEAEPWILAGDSPGGVGGRIFDPFKLAHRPQLHAPAIEPALLQHCGNGMPIGKVRPWRHALTVCHG